MTPGPDSPGAAPGCRRGPRLQALGILPSVIHLNEGHRAFATLEMVRAEMEVNAVPFGEAVRDIAAMTVFTTHTPVAAGHDRFPAGSSRNTWASSARRSTFRSTTSWG